jgi:hypothetical protein
LERPLEGLKKSFKIYLEGFLPYKNSKRPLKRPLTGLQKIFEQLLKRL